MCFNIASLVEVAPGIAPLMALLTPGRWIKALRLELFLLARGEDKLRLAVAANQFCVLLIQKFLLLTSCLAARIRMQAIVRGLKRVNQ